MVIVRGLWGERGTDFIITRRAGEGGEYLFRDSIRNKYSLLVYMFYYNKYQNEWVL